MANIKYEALLNLDIEEVTASTEASAKNMNAWFAQLLGCLAYLNEKSASSGRTLIGSSDTPINNNDTLFIIDGDLTGKTFEGASFTNATFSDTPPDSGENWMNTGNDAAALAAAGTLNNSIIDGNLTVSESASADKDTVFFAHITK